MNTAKKLARSLLLSGPGRLASRVLAPGTITILMLHRFAEADGLHPSGHTRAELRALLEGFRRWRVPIVSLGALVRQENQLPHGAVAFTVDDGYADFINVAWPVFQEFDCPVTVFLITGFLDRELWPWWERIRWAFDQANAAVRATGGAKPGAGAQFGGRSNAAGLIEYLKSVPDEAREEAIAALPRVLGVTIPVECPAADEPMSWDDVRRAGREGATFGPHTQTHPILSRVDAVRAETEIAESWSRVRAETNSAIPVFCYPNGDAASFGPREEALVARHGMSFAVSAIPGNATRADFASEAERQFRLPRYSCPHDAKSARLLASGWPRVWARARS